MVDVDLQVVVDVDFEVVVVMGVVVMATASACHLFVVAELVVEILLVVVVV